MWNNRKILARKNLFFEQNWYDAGNTEISGILNQNHNFLKWHEFVLKFNLNVPFALVANEGNLKNALCCMSTLFRVGMK